MSSWIISGGGHYHGCMAGRTRRVNTLVHPIDQRQTSTGGVAGCPGGGLRQVQGCSSGAGRAPVPSPMATGAVPASSLLQRPTLVPTEKDIAAAGGPWGSTGGIGHHGAAREPQSPLLALPIFSCGIVRGLHGSCAYLSYKGKPCHCHAA